MFAVAYGFYVGVEAARRQRRYQEPEPSAAELNAAYLQFATAGRSIEAPLRLAQSGDRSAEVTAETRWLWHCVLDLLTCLYFHHRHSEERVQDLIAGQQNDHERTRTRELVPDDLLGRFLPPAQLHNPDLVKEKFAEAMDRLILLRR